jgi:hypothetical protein
MRRYSESHEIRLLEQKLPDPIFELAHCGIRVRRIGPENFLIHDPADAELVHRAHGDSARTGVGVGGDSRDESFHDSEARGIEQHLLAHDLVAALPQLVYPLRESTVLEKSAHGGELEMRVDVDQARQQDRITQVVVVPAGRSRARTDICDESVALDDGSIFNWRLGDWEHPARVVAHQRGVFAGGGTAVGLVSVRGRVESRRMVLPRLRVVSNTVGARG